MPFEIRSFAALGFGSHLVVFQNDVLICPGSVSQSYIKICGYFLGYNFKFHSY